MSLRIRDFYTVQALYRPGQLLAFRAEIDASRACHASARLNVVRPAGLTLQTCQDIALQAGLTRVDFAAKVPSRAGHGYVVQLVLKDDRDEQVTAFGAADVLRSWRDDPRYGFLSDFGRDDREIPDRVARTARFHLNCLQFYDWMYRHYRLLPPRKHFRDALGRRLSLGAVRKAIDACHAHQIRALAYAAVYAAEPEFFRQHRNWGLYTADGSSHRLGRLFHLMDLAPNSAWRRYLLGDFRRTLRAVPFDGFHLDQYGFPRVAYTKTGALRDVARDFADFVDDAAAVVRGRNREAGVIFNAVNGWPMEDVARRKQVATYIEVWPPHVTYADLVGLVRRSHDLAPGKPVILAAYPSFLRRPKRPSPHAVANSLTLMSAVILGSGAWHLLLGEADGALAHPYYPNYVRLPAEAVSQLRRYYDFAVGYREFLRDPTLRDVAATFVDSSGSSFRVSLPYSSVPTARRIWVGMRAKPDWVVISLVNLLGEAEIPWDQPRKARRARDIRVRLPTEARIRRCLVASPDGGESLVPAAYGVGRGRRPTIQVPLSTWTLVLLETDG